MYVCLDGNILDNVWEKCAVCCGVAVEYLVGYTQVKCDALWLVEKRLYSPHVSPRICTGYAQVVNITRRAFPLRNLSPALSPRPDPGVFRFFHMRAWRLCGLDLQSIRL